MLYKSRPELKEAIKYIANNIIATGLKCDELRKIDFFDKLQKLGPDESTKTADNQKGYCADIGKFRNDISLSVFIYSRRKDAIIWFGFKGKRTDMGNFIDNLPPNEQPISAPSSQMIISPLLDKNLGKFIEDKTTKDNNEDIQTSHTRYAGIYMALNFERSSYDQTVRDAINFYRDLAGR